MSNNTGSQAFPIIGTHEDVIEVGMTLRDYFAANAMQSILVMDGIPYLSRYKEHAQDAYMQADAMLAARDREVRAELAVRGPVLSEWVPVSESPEKHGVYAVWIEADSPPRQFHGHGYYDGSDGWKMVQAADEYRSDNPAFEDYGMRVMFYVRDDELTPPTESSLLERAKR